MLTVERSRDFAALAKIFRQPEDRLRSLPCMFFIVTNDNVASGGFMVEDHNPREMMLHTELSIKGRQALEAFQGLLACLKAQNETRTLRTYVKEPQKKAGRLVKLAALIAGFKTEFQTGDTLFLCFPSFS